MRIITVSGAHSGVGKTKIAERLLKILKGWSALKISVSHNGLCPTGKDCGVCDRMDSEFSIVTDKDKLNERGKDTQRLKKAGAEKVLWLKAKPKGLRQGLMKAISKFQGAKGLIIEGNSVLKYINPDLAIFVKRENSRLKNSAGQALKKTDLIMIL